MVASPAGAVAHPADGTASCIVKFISHTPLTGGMSVWYNMPMPVIGKRPKSFTALRIRRHSGRPSHDAINAAKLRSKRKFLEIMGLHVAGALDYMKFVDMPKNPKLNKARREAPRQNKITGVEIVDPTPVVYNTTITDTFQTVINALIAGKEVPGFALLPPHKAKTNPTVDTIIIDGFTVEDGYASNHPLRGQCLVLLKPAFIAEPYRPDYASYKEYLEGGKNLVDRLK